MKRTLCLGALLGATLLTGGCAEQRSPATTPSPVLVKPSAAPSGAASAAPSGTASAAPSSTASAAPSGTASAAPSGTASAAPSGAASAAPSGAASAAPSGKASAAPKPEAPAGGTSQATGAAGPVSVEAIEAKSKLLPAVAEPDPAHLVRLYVMEDGSLKPPAFKVPAGEMFALVINNYGTEAAALEIRGGSAPVKASAVSGKRTTLPLKLESGAYTIAVGGKSVPLTAK